MTVLKCYPVTAWIGLWVAGLGLGKFSRQSGCRVCWVDAVSARWVWLAGTVLCNWNLQALGAKCRLRCMQILSARVQTKQLAQSYVHGLAVAPVLLQLFGFGPCSGGAGVLDMRRFLVVDKMKVTVVLEQSANVF